MRTQHDPTTNTISIEGLAQPLSILHVTDSHMALADERDPEALPHADHYGALFRERTPDGVEPEALFSQALARGEAHGVAATVLTGDIIHFPAHAGLERIAEKVGALSAPYLYTLGNHDWHFPHLDWNDATRQAHCARFASLTGGAPAAQALDVGEVRLIALDNSTYQITDAQLDFLRQQLDAPGPCLLFVHIPIALPTLIPDVVEVWREPIVMGADGWSEEGRAKWKVEENEASTRACLDLVGRAENLVGIFCGHVHFDHVDRVHDGCYQYVTQPCFEGAHRTIRLAPLD